MTPKAIRLLVLTLSLILFGAAQASAQGVPIYNNIPNPLPGNLPSVGYEASFSSEFGDRVTFAPSTGRGVTTVVQTMSSWGCESGHWYSFDCVTTPGATFSHSGTLNLYNVGPGNQPGALLGSVTQTFAIPYRPSADIINCNGGNAGKWFDAASGTCFNGKAVNITFDLRSLHLTLPNQVIFGIAYNTSHAGYNPIGDNTTCFTSSGGCGYDSLNVATADPASSLSVGGNPAPDDAYFNDNYGFNYCAGGGGGVTFFRLAAGCWTGLKPATMFNAATPPATKDDCKGDGWKTRTNGAGQTFPNQGQCVQYFNTGK